MICKRCNKEKPKWLWLSVECRPEPVCYDCALVAELYCPKHRVITHDLDDGTLCHLCVEEVPELQYSPQARVVSGRVQRYVSHRELEKLVQWVALARYAEPLSIRESLWWAVLAKKWRSEQTLDDIEATIKQQGHLGTLVPFSRNIRAADIAAFDPPHWVELVHQSGVPLSYAEAVWRSAVAEAKRDRVAFSVFLQKLSARLPRVSQQPKELSNVEA